MEPERQEAEEVRGYGTFGSTSSPLLVSWSLAGGGVVAVALGWLVAKLNVIGFTPVGLLPLAIGIALGTAAGSLAAVARIAQPKRLILTTVVLAILAVLSEHAWLYRDFCRQWREARANEAKIAMFRPEKPWSPAEYFAQEATPRRIALWCVDAVLIVAGAVATALISRQCIVNRARPVVPDP
jgi:hypothetical protein